PEPPYSYALDLVADVPAIVTNYAGIGKIGFELWQMEQFTAAQLANSGISGPLAAPAGDGVANLIKYALGLAPFSQAPRTLTPFRVQNGAAVLTYARPAAATDIAYIVQISSNLSVWSNSTVTPQLAGTTNGLQIWEARDAVVENSSRFFRLTLHR